MDIEIDERVSRGDKILHNICRVLDSRSWVLPETMAVTFDNVITCFNSQLESLRAIFSHFETVIKSSHEHITLDAIEKEYISIIIYSLNYLNPHAVQPREFWKHLYQIKVNKSWEKIILLIELCLCAPYSNASLERFFSQMRLVKTDWRNRLNEENLTHLLRIKVEGPTFKEFHENICSNAVNLWYNDKPQRTHQSKRKSYKERKGAKPKFQKLDFKLPSIFDDASDSGDSEDSIDQ